MSLYFNNYYTIFLNNVNEVKFCLYLSIINRFSKLILTFSEMLLINCATKYSRFEGVCHFMNDILQHWQEFLIQHPRFWRYLSISPVNSKYVRIRTCLLQNFYISKEKFYSVHMTVKIIECYVQINTFGGEKNWIII